MKKTILFLILLFVCVVNADLMAQCAMCKAVPTSNMAGGGSVGSTLNTGILYLMAIPYLLLMGGAPFFRNQVRENSVFKQRKH